MKARKIAAATRPLPRFQPKSGSVFSRSQVHSPGIPSGIVCSQSNDRASPEPNSATRMFPVLIELSTVSWSIPSPRVIVEEFAFPLSSLSHSGCTRDSQQNHIIFSTFKGDFLSSPRWTRCDHSWRHHGARTGPHRHPRLVACQSHRTRLRASA